MYLGYRMKNSNQTNTVKPSDKSKIEHRKTLIKVQSIEQSFKVGEDRCTS